MAHRQPRQARLVALHYRDFRLLWFGQLVSTSGSMMQVAAINWHIYQLIGNRSLALVFLGHTIRLNSGAIALGGVGMARFIPIVIFALMGGVFADARDRRRLMMVTQSAMMLFSAVLAAATLRGDVPLWLIYAVTALGAAAAAFDSPARQSLVPNLVPREHLANAISLNTLLWQIGTIAGPTLAGLLISWLSVGVVYAFNAISFLAVLIALASMHYRGRAASSRPLSKGSLLEGLRFVFSSRIILSTMFLDFFATFFSSATTLAPIFATDILHVGSRGYGLLLAAPAVGAVIAGMFLSIRDSIPHQGKVLLVAVSFYGLATVLFGISRWFLLSLLFLAAVGAADTVSTVIRSTLRQLITPDEVRGRMTSVNMVFVMGGPQLGEFESGLVAGGLGAPFAVVTGGLATILLTAWVAWTFPRLRRYEGETVQRLPATV
ncbi:MAG: MFS transporter [Ardenticatenaceae bacterium]|nr:MFS transporter [Ardenticatenaceae bacterium]HBY98279.1 MFS transporter [Chloroflexota bacterium]